MRTVAPLPSGISSPDLSDTRIVFLATVALLIGGGSEPTEAQLVWTTSKEETRFAYLQIGAAAEDDLRALSDRFSRSPAT